jgi:hypothetical protein
LPITTGINCQEIDLFGKGDEIPMGHFSSLDVCGSTACIYLNFLFCDELLFVGLLQDVKELP